MKKVEVENHYLSKLFYVRVRLKNLRIGGKALAFTGKK